MADLLAAALGYAGRGWRVFPCDPKTKRPLLPGKQGEGGLHLASADAGELTQWWTRWPKALIGVPTGANVKAFVLDFDAGSDEKTGEIFELSDLLGALEKEIGCRLPETWAVKTPRGGRHLWFRLPEFLPADPSTSEVRDGSATIKNRAGILKRVDVRGEGGYVILPPSARPDGKAYEWIVAPFEGSEDLGLWEAPPALLDLVLRRGKWARRAPVVAEYQELASDISPADLGKKFAATVKTGSISERAVAAMPKPASAAQARVDAIRKYALAALDNEARAVREAADGTRNDTLNTAALKLGHLVGAGALEESVVRAALEGIARAWPDFPKSQGTIESGLRAGIAEPTDLSKIGTRARQPSKPAARLRVVSGTAAPARRGIDGDELRDLATQKRRRFDPPPNEARNGCPPGQWTPDRLGLPRESPCTVEPLGIDGRTYHFLDSAGQLAASSANSLNHAGIQDLFAATPNWPQWAWPRYGRKPKDWPEDVPPPIESFKDDKVREGLFQACERKGLFSVRDKVRGRGGWKLADGSLIYHAGEELWVIEGERVKARATGVIEDGAAELVFPRMPPLPAPWPEPVTAKDNPARALIEGFRTWNWERPETDPILLLGWIGVAFLGGALDWRSAVFIVGDKETGKSALQNSIKDIFGEALLDSAGTTAAGIYHNLGHDSRPVAVDELEAKADNRKVMAVVELARSASSGSFERRGSSDHRLGGIEFQMRSAFLFSAINNPPLFPQDLSRLAFVRLLPLPPERASQPVPTVNVETCGRKILARLMQEWHRFPQVLEAYREQMLAGGHTGRGADTYGTLLACAHVILGEELADDLKIPMVEDLTPWARMLAADNLPEVEDALPNWRMALNWLFTARVDAWRSGERSTIGQLIEDLLAGDLTEIKWVKRHLAQAGVGLLAPGKIPGVPGYVLAVPNQSQQVQQLFWGSPWQGAPGAGVWASAFRQGPSDIFIVAKEHNRVRINLVQERCTLIVLNKGSPRDQVPAPDRD